MPAQRVHAVVRTLAGVLMTLAIARAERLRAKRDERRRRHHQSHPDGRARRARQRLGLVRRSQGRVEHQPANGTATCSALGACLYKANGGFTGNDSFAYTARDTATGTQDTATVNVTVSAGTAAARSSRATTTSRRSSTRRPGPRARQRRGRRHDVRGRRAAEARHRLLRRGRGLHVHPAAGYVGSDGFRTHQSKRPAGLEAEPRRRGRPRRRPRLVVRGRAHPRGARRHGLPHRRRRLARQRPARRQGELGARRLHGSRRHQRRGAARAGAPLRLGDAQRPARAGLRQPEARTGWSAERGADGKLHYSAGDNALLGEARTQTFPKPLPRSARAPAVTATCRS